MVRGAFPLGGDVAQRQPDQFRGRIVVGKMPARLDDLPQLRMDTLESVGRVENPSDLGRKCEEGNHVYPGPSPRIDDGWKLRSPGTASEVVQGRARRV